jgi:SsrA-binding protein
MARTGGTKLVADNRRARHDYHLLERFEAGLALTGTEVKSLREGRVSLARAFADVRDGEVWLVGAHIASYDKGGFANHDPDRDRKLLLHRREIEQLQAKVAAKGLTLVPLKLYLKGGKAKVELGLARGKKLYDKREAIAERDVKRELDRIVRKG